MDTLFQCADHGGAFAHDCDECASVLDAVQALVSGGGTAEVAVLDALNRAIRVLATDHMGTSVHDAPYGADWRRPQSCDACARLVLSELRDGLRETTLRV